MVNLNHVTLIGHLTRDAELRFTPNGTPVATLPLAVNHRYRQGNEWKNDVCYIDGTVFGRQAEAIAETVSKGSPVLVQGRLRFRSWETQDGQKRSKHDVLATTVQALPHSTNGATAPAREPDEAWDGVPF